MRKDMKVAAFATVLLLMTSLFLVYTFVKAEPEGATVQNISWTTKAGSPPDSLNDSKGSITTVLISVTQQNIKWKAYVGNVSGTLVLRDADSYSIYEWSSGGSPTGEVYITRNSSVDWGSIQCADNTSMIFEENTLGHSLTAGDNIANTFNSKTHAGFDVGIVPIGASTCNSTATWSNNTLPTMTETVPFQEVLLMDNADTLIYATIINQDTSSFRDDNDNTTYDFQAIVPDYTTAEQAVYYFYVEIDG